MLRDAVLLMSFGAGSYLWLCAIASPLASSGRSLLVRRGDRTAWTALALAVAGAALWTAALAGVIAGGRIIESAAGVTVLRSDIIWRGITLGNIAWVCQMLTFARMPRFGPTFETSTAIAMVAFVWDDARTLSRVERLYRAHAVAAVPVTPDLSRPVVASVRPVAA